MEYYNGIGSKVISESDEFTRYLASVKSEPWANKNIRLVKYIDGQLSSIPSSRAQSAVNKKVLSLGETKDRLGLIQG
jgi:hypothetical protein